MPERPKTDLERADKRAEVQGTDDPPVVARLVVEIRSDGSRTIDSWAIAPMIGASDRR